jgi:hypothetical protein
MRDRVRTLKFVTVHTKTCASCNAASARMTAAAQKHAGFGAVVRAVWQTRTGYVFCLLRFRTMQITRRRILDVALGVGGVMMLMVALLVFDHRTRYVGADFASVSEDVNYFAVAVTLVIAQVMRGEFVDYTSMLLFTTTAVVLVALLMRL